MQVIRPGLAVAALAGAAAVLVPTPIVAQTTGAWTIYVADEQANVVRPIDAGTLTVGAPITVGAGPQSMAITPDARTLYVANSAGGSVTPVDIATGTAAAPSSSRRAPMPAACRSGPTARPRTSRTPG